MDFLVEYSITKIFDSYCPTLFPVIKSDLLCLVCQLVIFVLCFAMFFTAQEKVCHEIAYKLEMDEMKRDAEPQTRRILEFEAKK